MGDKDLDTNEQGSKLPYNNQRIREPAKSLNHATHHVNFDDVCIMLMLVVIKLSLLCQNLPEYDGTLIWELAVPSPPSPYARTSII